jgi:hypothetical protein
MVEIDEQRSAEVFCQAQSNISDCLKIAAYPYIPLSKKIFDEAER